jgi:hypothetical protein
MNEGPATLISYVRSYDPGEQLKLATSLESVFSELQFFRFHVTFASRGNLVLKHFSFI